jgi:hypothetical protein
MIPAVVFAFLPQFMHVQSVLQLYLLIMFIHFAAYPWASRYTDSNDFNGLRSISRPIEGDDDRGGI